MQVVTDNAADMKHEEGLPLHFVPLSFTIDGKSYKSGVDVTVEQFYQILASAKDYPTTAQPAPGEFAEIYRRIAATDPDILSIHVSSGLSGTLNAAQAGAQLVPEAKVTFVDSRTLSGALAWQVIAGAHAVKQGWTLDKILPMLKKVSDNTDLIFTVDTLEYLVHGGRVSHIQGMVANLLNIKPIIGVDKSVGKYEQLGRARTIKKAVKAMVDHALKKHPEGTKMRLQIAHGDAPEIVAMIEENLKAVYDCHFLPTLQVAPVLAAHTGPTMAGFAYGPLAAFADIP